MRLSRCSPEARRSGRKHSQLDPLRCSSRSRSPRACQTRAMQESRGIKAVTWERVCVVLDPPLEVIARQAEVVIRRFLRTDAGCSTSGDFFYVGVSR